MHVYFCKRPLFFAVFRIRFILILIRILGNPRENKDPALDLDPAFFLVFFYQKYISSKNDLFWYL